MLTDVLALSLASLNSSVTFLQCWNLRNIFIERASLDFSTYLLSSTGLVSVQDNNFLEKIMCALKGQSSKRRNFSSEAWKSRTVLYVPGHCFQCYNSIQSSKQRRKKEEESNPNTSRSNTGAAGHTMRHNTKKPKNDIPEAPNRSRKGPNSPIPAQEHAYPFHLIIKNTYQKKIVWG